MTYNFIILKHNYIHVDHFTLSKDIDAESPIIIFVWGERGGGGTVCIFYSISA